MSPLPTPLREERTMEDIAAPVLLLGIRALNEKALLWLVTIAAGFCWGFTVYRPEPWRIVAAMLATVTVLIPILWKRGE